MAQASEAHREMEMVVRGEGVTIFSDKELGDMNGLTKGPDYIEVTCGCTDRKYGDTVGKLRVSLGGELQITCDCTAGCHEEKLTPDAFEKHSVTQGARNWKSHIWVIIKGKKVPLRRTVLLKYYKETSTEANGSYSSRKRIFHHDEFIRCSRCNKERRFRLRTKEECRIHHDASADRNWNCADFPYDKISCDDEEERASRKGCRGCPRNPTCSGCTSCVCFGCQKCRFPDCNCRNCVDFIGNAGA